MKKIIKLISFAILMMSIATSQSLGQEHNHKHNTDIKSGEISSKKIMQYDKNKDGKVYQCPMHKNQISDKESNCQECGMKMAEVSINVKDRGLMKNGQMMNLKEAKAHKEQIAAAKKNFIVRKGVIDVEAIDENGDGKVFQDQMDWNVISDEAGECPVCGMNLKEVSIKDAINKLKENGYKVK